MSATARERRCFFMDTVKVKVKVKIKKVKP
jgi:hypothetical protein